MQNQNPSEAFKISKKVEITVPYCRGTQYEILIIKDLDSVLLYSIDKMFLRYWRAQKIRASICCISTQGSF
jgi:hypothetical protein